MKLSTLVLALLGQREAILRAAAAPGTVWVGLTAVALAAVAREYDATWLGGEPEVLLIPLVASLVACGFVFLWVCAGRAGPARKAQRRGIPLPPRPGFRAFLGLFWLTAPLAWSYAIPWERVCDPLGAAKLNLATLGLVATWRVAYTIRCVQVLFGATPLASAILVLFPASVIALSALFAGAAEVVMIMGGVRPSAAEALVMNVALGAFQLALWTAPVWFIGSLWVGSRPPDPREWAPPPPVEPECSLQVWPLLAAAALALVGGLLVAQPEQRRAWEVDQLARSGGYPAALAAMGDTSPGDFPPGWAPPPRRFYGPEVIVDVIAAVSSQRAPAWIRKGYLEQLERSVGTLGHADDDQRDRLLDALEAWPDPAELRAAPEALGELGRGTPRQVKRVERLQGRAGE